MLRGWESHSSETLGFPTLAELAAFLRGETLCFPDPLPVRLSDSQKNFILNNQIFNDISFVAGVGVEPT